MVLTPQSTSPKLQDISGCSFGMWTVLKYLTDCKWLCRCECGTEKAVRASELRNGRSTGCRCIPPIKEGDRFHNLTVVQTNINTNDSGRLYSLCICDCGEPYLVVNQRLRSGVIKSCGCKWMEAHEPTDPEERFWALVDKEGPLYKGTPCWICKGIRENAYGRFTYTREDGMVIAVSSHVFVHQMIFGPVAKGKELDHLCRNKRCVNPIHTQPVTHFENSRRGNCPWAVKRRGYRV